MDLTASDYLGQLQALLPHGPAWTADNEAAVTKQLGAIAAEFARVDARARRLVDEADPRSTFELLPDWERVCGLPDSCSAELAATLQERRAEVVSRLTAQGGASLAYFIGLAAAMGYAIEIDEFRPFVAGWSRCGARLNGDHAVRYQWRVRVSGPRYTPFRTGASQAGDRLGKIVQAEDLECKLKRLKPAHTNLIFAYEGA